MGWALGDGREHGDDSAWDAVEAEALYALLEQHIVPEFFDRGKTGIPAAWVKRMRESMAQLTPQFSTSRTVHEYTEKHYLPAASNYRARVADGGAVAKRIVQWQRRLEGEWEKVQFGPVRVATSEGQHTFEAVVRFDDLNPDAVRVELYAMGLAAGGPERHEMKRGTQASPSSYVYSATLPAVRSAADYTARVVPFFEGVAVPLEDCRVLWQR